MANLLDYLHWRGDLEFSASPFNEIDAAILAMFSYVPMAGIIPGLESESRITLKVAVDQILAQASPDKEKFATTSENNPTFNAKFNSDLAEMLSILAACPRFAGLWLSGFEKHTDFIVGRQFAAVTFTLPVPSPEHVVAFRGTDGTFVGWKEDFELAYMEQIPAQASAQAYLEQVMAKLPGQFTLCGHSKGGNLAVYAAAHMPASHQERISTIFDFDGPGFNFTNLDRSPYHTCAEKVIQLVPEQSMIGMLFETIGARKVVSSLALSTSQHNVFFWNLERAEFIRGELADSAKMLDGIINAWASDLSVSEWQTFLETIFDLLGNVDEDVIARDPLTGLTYILNTLKKYHQLDRKTRSAINQVFGSLTTQTKRTLTTTIQQKLPGSKTTG